MDEKGKIVWLASYPKSGNTWFRVFLANIMSNSEIPADINELFDSTIASNRQVFDETTGFSASDLTLKEIEKLRPYVYDSIAEKSSGLTFMKIHDAFIYTSEGRPLVSENAGFKAIYIIRNPLDVAVSLAHHLSVPMDKAVENICNESFSFCNHVDRLHNQLEQRLLSWSSHVLSWTGQKLLPIKVLRYEDMLNNTFQTFTDALKFIGIEKTENEILKSIRFSSFDELQKQESLKGFKEKSPGPESFFRKGRNGTWHEELQANHVSKIISKHSILMKKYGYIDNTKNPI
jgi:hypothetical protein